MPKRFYVTQIFTTEWWSCRLDLDLNPVHFMSDVPLLCDAQGTSFDLRTMSIAQWRTFNMESILDNIKQSWANTKLLLINAAKIRSILDQC